jgi:5-oxoprolinase (ATP-hydrolysing)
VVGRAPDGALHTLKLLSECPDQYHDAAVEGIRRLLHLGPGEPVGAGRIECVKMGTTVATNALLERTGDRTLLVTTAGFRDALRIAYQNRPHLFKRRISLPELLYEQVIEARERVLADGTVEQSLEGEALRAGLLAAHAAGFRAIAIVFMHAWRHPDHERTAALIARECGFIQISVSHAVSPLIKFVSRGDTTVVDAYLSPVLRRYVDQLACQLPGVPLYFMQSSGGLSEARSFQGKDAILSGPAGGIVGMARTAALGGHFKVIGFDMGGTSTDVSHYAGTFERAFETIVAGVRVRAPIMNIHTVAAGGGSILAFDGARLRVGPASAGAVPGPRSYRRGGPLCITDANVLLGRIQPDYFPHVFGADGNQALDSAAVAASFAQLAHEVRRAGFHDTTPETLAAGFLRIAVQSMANAIKRVSVERGYDVTRYTLQCFGGAGGQHACAVADALGIERVYVHPLAGVLSAYGMGVADQGVIRDSSVERPLNEENLVHANAALDTLSRAAVDELLRQGVARDAIQCRRRFNVRYAGTDSPLTVNGGTLPEMRAGFEAMYQTRFAFLMAGRELIIDSVSVEAVAPGEPVAPTPPLGEAAPRIPRVEAVVPMYAEQWHQTPLYVGEGLAPGSGMDGPAIIAHRNGTTVIDPGWRAQVDAIGALQLSRRVARQHTPAAGTSADPISLEVFNHLFMNIAEQMGLQLQNTAHSVNIKERLDFSCALFDADGRLIANAPHMPVHLGSMGESITTVIARNPQMRSGDVFMLNDPYHGGTHLPDITVVSPVYVQPTDARPTFFVASRGHHADIGGITPGSMPPFSRSIDEEGVLFDNFLLAQNGHFNEAPLLAALTRGSHPARNPAQTIADLQAQIAANEKGLQELHALVAQFGRDTVAAYMAHVQNNAEESVRRAIAVLHDGCYELPLDNGAVIKVAVSVNRSTREATIDFSGTSAQLPNNFNAPRAVTLAAVLYVFRTLVDDDIPLNAGCFKPLHVIVPEGCMLNPRFPAGVVAGNVETSTCVTNALYGALGIMAAAQLTMNNFTFGNDAHQYYETIAGGSGAGNGFAGASAVQTHMTNSRLTDPEVLESRYPVVLESFEIRRGSGGIGEWRGGDGGTRRIRFLETMTASILSNGRVVPAFGLAGGGCGALGENVIERRDGTVEHYPHIASSTVSPGDVVVIKTPGGGGYGRPT